MNLQQDIQNKAMEKLAVIVDRAGSNALNSLNAALPTLRAPEMGLAALGHRLETRMPPIAIKVPSNIENIKFMDPLEGLKRSLSKNIIQGISPSAVGSPKMDVLGSVLRKLGLIY